MLYTATPRDLRHYIIIAQHNQHLYQLGSNSSDVDYYVIKNFLQCVLNTIDRFPVKVKNPNYIVKRNKVLSLKLLAGSIVLDNFCTADIYSVVPRPLADRLFANQVYLKKHLAVSLSSALLRSHLQKLINCYASIGDPDQIPTFLVEHSKTYNLWDTWFAHAFDEGLEPKPRLQAGLDTAEFLLSSKVLLPHNQLKHYLLTALDDNCDVCNAYTIIGSSNSFWPSRVGACDRHPLPIPPRQPSTADFSIRPRSRANYSQHSYERLADTFPIQRCACACGKRNLVLRPSLNEDNFVSFAHNHILRECEDTFEREQQRQLFLENQSAQDREVQASPEVHWAHICPIYEIRRAFAVWRKQPGLLILSLNQDIGSAIPYLCQVLDEEGHISQDVTTLSPHSSTELQGVEYLPLHETPQWAVGPYHHPTSLLGSAPEGITLQYLQGAILLSRVQYPHPATLIPNLDWSLISTVNIT
jgi:hypothetical protein